MAAPVPSEGARTLQLQVGVDIGSQFVAGCRVLWYEVNLDVLHQGLGHVLHLHPRRFHQVKVESSKSSSSHGIPSFY